MSGRFSKQTDLRAPPNSTLPMRRSWSFQIETTRPGIPKHMSAPIGMMRWRADPNLNPHPPEELGGVEILQIRPKSEKQWQFPEATRLQKRHRSKRLDSSRNCYECGSRRESGCVL